MGAHFGSFITLTGTHSSLVLELLPSGAPIWRHWGGKLNTATMPPNLASAARPTPTFSLDDDFPLTLLPTFGLGWFGAPALLASSQDGTGFTQSFDACDFIWTRPDHGVQFTLSDSVNQIDVVIDLDLDPTNDVLTCQTRVRNLGSKTLMLSWLASGCLPLPSAAKTVRYYTGRHNHEFSVREDALGSAAWVRENRRGLTSHDSVPGGVVTTDATNHHMGECYGAQLAWSGNHSQRIEATHNGGYQWQMGAWLAPGEVSLATGETFQAPPLLATFSPNGLNGVAQNFHSAVRARMRWPATQMKPRPVHFNTWEGVYFDLKEDALKDMADGAAALGVERFVLDDGWFHSRRSDMAGLGDWWVDEDIFPTGLGPLAAHVNALGMEFGLWVEPEMVNPDSDLYRAHPDWVLHVSGKPLLTARNQLVLDLTNPDVFDYLLEKLTALLDSLTIGYLKWDHNRDLTGAGSGGRAAYHRQVIAAYALFDAVRTKWPDVEIEACAGGGGRIDAGILARTHRVWTSDCIDAVSRVAIQRGFLQFFPPEIMGSHIGTSPAHSTGRSQSMEFRGAVALSGHFGIELDPRHLSSSDKIRVGAWVKSYKALRETLHGKSIWQGEGADGIVWHAQGSVDDFVLFAFRTQPACLRWPPRIALPFVEKGATYSLRLVNTGLAFGPTDGAFFSDLAQGGVSIAGDWLAAAGLDLPNLKAESALIVRFTAL